MDTSFNLVASQKRRESQSGARSLVMIEVSDLPAPSAGMFGCTVLLLSEVGFGRDLAVLCLSSWLLGQYITAGAEEE